MESALDTNVCKELAQSIETLTHSGQKTLNIEELKKIKNICKISAEYQEQTYKHLFHFMKKRHSEIRYSAFQICDYIFRRSQVFRELVESDMKLLMELTTETNLDLPLPPPKSAAKNLKRLALQTIHEWNKEYGNYHVKLRVGYNYLQHCKKVDFQALEMQNAAERTRLKAEEERKKYLEEQKIKKVQNEMKDFMPEIGNSQAVLDNCVSLLLPPLESFFVQDEVEDEDVKPDLSSSVKAMEHSGHNDNINNESDSDTDERNNPLREAGILSADFNIEVNVNVEKPVVKITADNADIVENARDNFILMKNRYIPKIKKWISILTEVSENHDVMKTLTELKRSLEKSIIKFSQLNLQADLGNESDSSHSDFEEVQEKEGYESVVKDYVKPAATPQTDLKSTSKSEDKQSSWGLFSQETSAEDPTTIQSTISSLKKKSSSSKTSSSTSKESTKTPKPFKEKNRLVDCDMFSDPQPSTSKGEPQEPQPSTSKSEPREKSRKAKLLAVAPKLPFDIDLYHWEDEKLTAPTMLSVKSESARFWSSVSTDDLDEIPVPEGAASLRTRVIEFSGQFEPVKWACRAPLPNGKLCPRRDRRKCPFHGPVVPRDETGKRTDMKEEEKGENSEIKQEEEEKNEIPDWQDPKLLEEIKEATGVDLKMPEKKKKGEKKPRKKSEKQTFKDKYPGLTDISVRQSTSYSRLSKIIFKKSAMKRVAKALDTQDHKRFRDKYGDQFNYVHDTT